MEDNENINSIREIPMAILKPVQYFFYDYPFPILESNGRNQSERYTVTSNGNPFRQLEPHERDNLVTSLVKSGKMLSPLIVKQDRKEFIILDGHHRWSLLKEVYEQNKLFDRKIPIQVVEFDSPEEETKYILDLQIGRRNLSKEEIAAYVDTLKATGLSQRQAIKEEAQTFNREEHLTINGLSKEEKDLFELAADGQTTLAILPKHEALFNYCKGHSFPYIFLNETCRSTFVAPNYTEISAQEPNGDYTNQEELFELYTNYYTKHRMGLSVKAKEQLSGKLLFAKWGDNDSLIEDCPYSVMLNLIE